jgi:hypothetical protein
MTNLTPAQSAAIEAVSKVDLAYREARLTAEKRARDIVRRELEGVEIQRAQAVYHAHSLNVPKAQIAREGLHTSNRGQVDGILQRFAVLAPLVPVAPSSVPLPHAQPAPGAVPQYTAPLAPPAPFEWVDRAREVVRVHVRNFPTVSKREGFPETLEGVVQRDEVARSGWVVLEDPTDEPTPFGPIAGFLRDEIDRNWFPGEEPEGSHLPSVLEAWAALNR